MTEVRTRDEALVSVDRSLAQWAAAATGVMTQASAASSAATHEADGAVRRFATEVRALEQLLSSLVPEDDRGRVERDLANAQSSLRAARNAAQRIAAASQRLSALTRSQRNSLDALLESARADLSKRGGELGSYRGGGGVGGVGSSGGGAVSPSGQLTGGNGLSSVDVSAADFGDNPILDGFTKGGTTRADYRWAVQTWDEVVGPGVARGMSREDFEARDRARGATGLRRTAGVFDMFLGDSDRLRVTRRPDGSLDVTNGRHRLEIARELGIKSLPGEVIDP